LPSASALKATEQMAKNAIKNRFIIVFVIYAFV